jgi:GIY-YIG catalytic domain
MMPLESITESLINSESRCPANQAEEQVPRNPGFYAIFVDRIDNLPVPFPDILRTKRHHQPLKELLYIGIAETSLQKRLVGQDLRQCGNFSFFRSLGAILGFRPPSGSLCGKANQCNYKFSKPDTACIIRWINENLSIRWLCRTPATLNVEKEAIKWHQPLLNIEHNPSPTPEVGDIGSGCGGCQSDSREASRDHLGSFILHVRINEDRS